MTPLVIFPRATLEEAVHADLIVHVVDRSNPSWIKQREVVMKELKRIFANSEVLSLGSKSKGVGEQFGPNKFPKIVEVWNKIDLIEDDGVLSKDVFVDTIVADEENSIEVPICVVPMSAKSGDGFCRFTKILSDIVHAELMDATIFIPYQSALQSNNDDQQRPIAIQNKISTGRGVIGVIYEQGEVVSVENNETGTILHCRLPTAVLEKLKKTLDVQILT